MMQKHVMNAEPYRYRKLTPEEQVEIVRQRRARGYPPHAPPHPYRHAGHYLITAVNYEHAPILASVERRTDFEAMLLHSMEDSGEAPCGWVILPNHYHILVGVETLDQVALTLKQLHGTTARAWNLADGLVGQRKVWHKYYDRVIRDQAHFFRALNYLHINPVKHGYAESPYEWPWASVETYLQAHGREWLRALWQAYPPGEFGAGWDE